MISSKRRSIPALMAGALSLTGVAAFGQQAAPPPQPQPSQQELLDTVRSLQAKVAQLEAGQQGTAAKVDAALVDRTVAEVLSDAERRSQLLQSSGFTAGYSKGKFVIQSEDGDFSLSPGIQLQLRYVANFRDEDPADDTGDSATENGFELRRMKFSFEGKAFGDFSYKIVWFTNRSGGGVALEDAIVKYNLSKELRLVGGQFKDPVHHEELVSSSKQVAVDRSLANELLGGGYLDRIQGVGAEYESGPIYVTAIFHDGLNSDNTTFRDSPANGTDYGGGGRLEYTLFGDRKMYGDFSAFDTQADSLILGVGADFTGLADGNSLTYTVDAHYETTTGLSVYGAFLGRTLEGTDDDDLDDGTDYGAVAQIGQMLSPKFELFGRYSYVQLDTEDRDDLHEITAGVNYFIQKHAAKVTADLTYLPSGTEADTGLGFLDSDEESQLVARVQFQLAL